MDPHKRLENGRAAAKAGRFEEALRDYVWFHNNALKYESSLSGVRLSYALSDWIGLGKSYPKAIAALERIRDRKIALLIGGEEVFSLFHDVVSINESLKCQKKTCEVFKELDRRYPEFARSCASVILGALVKCGEFELAKRYSDEPESALLRFANQLNARIYDLEIGSSFYASTLDAYLHIYCGNIETLADMLRGLGEGEQADHARLWAVALVDQDGARKKVEGILWSKDKA
jgi:hypothetical protein